MLLPHCGIQSPCRCQIYTLHLCHSTFVPLSLPQCGIHLPCRCQTHIRCTISSHHYANVALPLWHPLTMPLPDTSTCTVPFSYRAIITLPLWHLHNMPLPNTSTDAPALSPHCAIVTPHCEIHISCHCQTYPLHQCHSILIPHTHTHTYTHTLTCCAIARHVYRVKCIFVVCELAV